MCVFVCVRAMLSRGNESARVEALLDLQATSRNFVDGGMAVPGTGAIRIGKWKLLHGYQVRYFHDDTLPSCVARTGHSDCVKKPNKCFPLPVPANESTPYCAFGWTPPPRLPAEKYELPRPPADANCTGLPCVLTKDSGYIVGHTLLFDVVNDMSEEHNVAAQNPDVVKRLLSRLQQFNESHCGGARCEPVRERGRHGRPTTDPK